MAMARIFHDQPAIRDHKEKITWALIKRGVVNVNVLAGAWIYICDQITVQGLSIFTATILRLNYPDRTTVQIQLLSSAPPLVGMVFGLGVSYITMKTRQHGIAIALCAGMCVIGYSIWIASTDPQARYAAIFLNTAGGYSFGTLILGWTLANAAPDTVRNVANGAVSGLANIGMFLPRFCAMQALADVFRIHHRHLELHQDRCQYWLPHRQQPQHSYRSFGHHCVSASSFLPEA